MPAVSERTERVRRAVERFNAGDYDGFVEIFSPDVVLVADPQVADQSEYVGQSGVLAWIEEAHARWVGVRFAALAMEPLGEAILIELGVVGDTVAGGGAWRLYVLMRWADTHINVVQAYPSRDAALADVGGAGAS
jgi:hypothetical protein